MSVQVLAHWTRQRIPDVNLPGGRTKLQDDRVRTFTYYKIVKVQRDPEFLIHRSR